MNKQSGHFTIAALIIVLILIVVLSAVLIPRFNKWRSESKSSHVQSEQIPVYYRDVGDLFPR